jgi:hypothetical protein
MCTLIIFEVIAITVGSSTSAVVFMTAGVAETLSDTSHLTIYMTSFFGHCASLALCFTGFLSTYFEDFITGGLTIRISEETPPGTSIIFIITYSASMPTIV